MKVPDQCGRAPQGRISNGMSDRSAALAWLAGTAMTVLATLVVLATGLRLPSAERPVALVFAPGTSAVEAIGRLAALDGRLIATGGFENVVVAQFARDVGYGALRKEGVWLALEPLAFGGCLDLRASPEPTPLSRRDETT